MNSERELADGVKSIKSAWGREHTARCNLEKMLEDAESDNAKLRELVRDAIRATWACDNDECVHGAECGEGIDYPRVGDCAIERRARDLGIEVDHA